MSLTRTSRYISLILRHHPEKIGITLDEHGWARVDELIEGVSRTHEIDFSILEEIVATDSKQRYAFNEDRTLIRANQGHSVSVDVGLVEAMPPKYLFHGTAGKYVPLIDAMGLIPKQRLYVHLSNDVDTAVKVGSRHGTPVVYRVNSRKMFKDGFVFYLSANNVWLTEKVPAEYLEKIG